MMLDDGRPRLLCVGGSEACTASRIEISCMLFIDSDPFCNLC